MKQFELWEASLEVKNPMCIKEGCTLYHGGVDVFDKLVKSFDTEQEAMGALAEVRSSVRPFTGPAGKFYDVKEYFVQRTKYDDEDGEWSDSETLAFSKFRIKLETCDSHEPLGTFESYADAYEAYREYDGEECADIVF